MPVQAEPPTLLRVKRLPSSAESQTPPGATKAQPPCPDASASPSPAVAQVAGEGHTFTIDPATGCWNWSGTLTNRGYGSVCREGKKLLAHRVVYRAARGLEDHQDLDHLCRNRRCVNPAHLEIVTRGQNCRRGANTRLTYGQVEEMRRLHAEGHRPTDLAARYGTSLSNVCLILKRRRWNVGSAEEAYGGGAA